MSEALVFARPEVFLAFALLPVYVYLRIRGERSRVVSFPPLQHRRPGLWKRLAPQLLVPLEVLVVATVIFALAGPYRETELELIEQEGVDVLLVLDVSLSMLATDFEPNRLEALRRLARDFVARAGGHRIGTLIFAQDCYVQTPLTTDRRVLLELLDSVSVYALDQVKSGGTAVGDALLVAAEHLASRRIEGRDQAVVLITDGESNAGFDPVLAARHLRQLDIRSFAIGIGGEEPVEVVFQGERVGGDDPYLAYLDETELRAIAEAADGRFYRALDPGALERIFGELSRLQSAPLEVRRVAVRDSLADEASLGAAALFAVSLLLGGVVLRRPFR